MKFSPLLVMGGIFAAILLLTKNLHISNPFNPSNAPASPPGAAAQQAGQTPQAGTGGFNPNDTGVSPNSTLTTISGGIVVANNALGFLDKLGQYFGDNSDSEYPVPNPTPTGYGDYDTIGLPFDSNYLA